MSTNSTTHPEDGKTRTRTVLALACLITVAAINHVWLWGVLFALWAANGMVAGRAYLLEELPYTRFPLLCWSINIVWFLIGLSMIADPFLAASPPP